MSERRDEAGSELPPAGWYPSPNGDGLRYWGANGWTGHYHRQPEMSGVTPAAGWYPNPDGEGLRDWNEHEWTQQYLQSSTYLPSGEALPGHRNGADPDPKRRQPMPKPQPRRWWYSTRGMLASIIAVTLTLDLGGFLINDGITTPATRTMA